MAHIPASVYITKHIGSGFEYTHEYVSFGNVIRFGMRKPCMPAGQYEVYRMDGAERIRVGTAYRQA